MASDSGITAAQRRRRPLAVEERSARLIRQLGGFYLQLRWSGRRRFEIPFVDDAAAAMLGVDAKRAARDPATVLHEIEPADRWRVLRAFAVAFRRGGDVRCRYRLMVPAAGGRWREIIAGRDDPADRCLWWCCVRTVDPEDRASGSVPWILASVSHELRTPLNAVLGFAGLLRGDADEASPCQERYLAYLESAAKHLSAVIDDLADLPCIEAGSLALRVEPVPIRNVVEEALSMVEPTARQARVAIVVNGGDPSATARADPLRLKQVLLNLLSNAIKYDRRGHRVQVSWSCDPATRTIRVAVQDAGAGLRPEQLDSLFKPFRRLGAERSRTEGMGIGLVIARGLARMMQGDIEVESEAGRGSTFAIVLPASTG